MRQLPPVGERRWGVPPACHIHAEGQEHTHWDAYLLQARAAVIAVLATGVAQPFIDQAHHALAASRAYHPTALEDALDSADPFLVQSLGLLDPDALKDELAGLTSR